MSEIKLTFKSLQIKLHAMKMTVSCNDGEFRINFRYGKEETAYYTDNIDDAYRTAIDMYNRKQSLLEKQFHAKWLR